MMAKCPRCDDTGSTSKSLYGYLDCGHCDVATRRAELAEWAAAQRDEPHVLLWRAHLRALALAGGEDVELPRAQVLQLFRPRA